MANENDVLVIDGVLSICLDKKATSVVIPKDVKKIGYRTFCGCESLTSVEFGGTKTQWEAVTKGEDWIKKVRAKVVKCSEGEVAL